MLRRALLVLTVAPLLIAAPAVAQQKAPDPGQERPATLRDLVQCRAIGPAEARLACFDAAAARLDDAEKTGEVVVLDRSQVRTAKREAFGFSIPSFDLFDRDERQRAEEVDSIESTIASAYRGQRGWVVTLANRQVWSQTDNRRILRAKPGDKVEIRRGLVGSFFMRLGDQPGVRAERTR